MKSEAKSDTASASLGPGEASRALARSKDRVLREWEARARREVPAAGTQLRPALLDSLPLVIDELVDTLAQREPRLALRAEEKRLAREHGVERAQMPRYSLDQVIGEYQILKAVIFDVLEEAAPLSTVARDVIWEAILIAVRNAASEFAAHRETRLREEQAALVDNVVDYAIFLLDPEGRIKSWNAGAERMKGYRPEEIIGHPFAELYPPEDREKKRPEHNLREAAERGHVEDEGLRIRKDGSLFWASVNITRIDDGNGGIRGFAKVVRDLTQRKKMEDELRSAVRLRDEFLSIVSHELRTPVTALKLQIDMASRRLDSGDRRALEPVLYARRLGIFRRQLERLSQLIDDMLASVHRRGGDLPLQRAPFDLAELLEEVRAQLVADGTSESIDLDATPGTIIDADRDRIQRVVTQLLTNAVKFGEGRGIELKLLAENSHARLTVRDRGIGIDPKDHERIFGRFERAVGPSVAGGLGVGLYFARQAVLAHQGKIWVESGCGEGATFIVELPLKIAQSTVALEERDPPI